MIVAKLAKAILPCSLLFLGGLVNCSLVVDNDTAQCSTTADCTGRGPAFAGLLCSARGVCEKQAGCGSNQECVDANGGQPFLCRKETRTCVRLSTPECKPTLAEPADLLNQDTVWLGTIFPITGDDSGFGLSLQASTDLARKEWRDVARGLDPVAAGGARRPIAVMACDQAASDAAPDAIAKYLVEELKVPAIIGPAYSSIALQLVPEVIDKGVLMMGTPTTSPLLTDINSSNPRLFWRTTPSDNAQAAAIAGYINYLEPIVRANLRLAPTDPIKLQVTYRDDVYGKGVDTALAAVATVNGKSFTDPANAAYVHRVTHGQDETDPAPEAEYQSTAAQIVAFQPHIVVIVGFNTDGLSMTDLIEKNWTASYRPQLVGSSGLDDNFSYVSPDPTYRQRFVEVILGARAEWPNYATYTALYNAQVKDVELASDSVFAYDAFYSLAYAMSQVPSDQPLTGATVAGGMTKLTNLAGTKINVGTASLFNGQNLSRSQTAFNLEGASGPIDWNNATGDVAGDCDIRCIKMGTGALRFEASGQYYNSVTNKIEGTRAADCLNTY